jgi:hypothetical protein
MELPVSVTAAVARTRRQDFIAQADLDRTARIARVTGHPRLSHLLTRFAAAVLHRQSWGRQTMRQLPDFHQEPSSRRTVSIR